MASNYCMKKVYLYDFQCPSEYPESYDICYVEEAAKGTLYLANDSSNGWFVHDGKSFETGTAVATKEGISFDSKVWYTKQVTLKDAADAVADEYCSEIAKARNLVAYYKELLEELNNNYRN